MKVFENVTELVGKTPLLKLAKLQKEYNLNANIFAKLEAFNPAGSAKDRVALAMILDYEKKGLINKDTVIVEPTSGNTGVGLACICASRGYKLIVCMPETMSIERRNLMKAYGAELILTEGKKGMQGSVDKAEEIVKSTPNAIMAGQFTNMANPQVHFETTGPEIYSDLDGKVDIFVAGVGTGGSVSGVGKYLKSKNPNIKVVAVEPSDSPLLSKGTAGPHKLQGIGANFVPSTLDKNIYDEVITITTEEAFEMGKFLARKEGFLAGISSGAALYAGLKLAQREENKGKNIVVLLPDTGERYLSSAMFSE